MSGGGTRRVLEAWKLGVVKYGDALRLQERLVADRRAGRVPDLVLSLQHPPTYTLGKRHTDHNLLVPESDLRSLGAELHRTERGGDVTFHGPRQAVLYPILSLRDIGLGARRYVEGLESAMIEVALLYGVEARSGGAGETGVWVRDRKIGAIGVRISSGFTCHGLAFNIDPDLGYFKNIVPCGIANKEVTTLRREAAAELPPDEDWSSVQTGFCSTTPGPQEEWASERCVRGRFLFSEGVPRGAAPEEGELALAAGS